MDTNGDQRYNYLQLDVRISVTQAGSFTVTVLLKDDLDIAPLTSASTSGFLAAGTATVRILLDGPDIYNGGVDGPYYAHITLKSEYGTVLSTGTHVTSAYRFADFQSYAIRFVTPIKERSIDNDSDGLVDWLVLDLTLEVQTEDDYVVLSRLVDSSYTISLIWRSGVHLKPGRPEIVQFFRGYPLRLAGADGPFLVTTDLLDGRGVLVDFLFHQTAAYPASSFEYPPVVLKPPHIDWGVDPDGNGLYSVLEVRVGVTVQESTAVVLLAELRSGDGSVLVQSLELRPTLLGGTTSFTFLFAGPSIHKSGVDGPYLVRISVRDLEGRTLSTDTHATQPYSYEQFEYSAVALTPPHSDFGLDADRNGRYEALVLNLSVTVDVPRTFRLRAAIWGGLAGSEAMEIAEVDYEASPVVGYQVFPLEFPGSAINRTGIDGPYQVIINLTDAATGDSLDTGRYRTNGYFASDFEVGGAAYIAKVVQEEVLDTDGGDGMINILRLTVRLGVRIPANYRVEGDLDSGAERIAASATSGTWLEGTSDVTLSFSGWEIRAAARDGPYRLRLELKDPSSSTTLDVQEYTTAVYQAVSFQEASRASIFGRVVSSASGLPLEGAEVWAVNYSNAFARRTFADANGNFALPVFAAAHRLIVDHEGAQAKASWFALSGDTTVNVALDKQKSNSLHRDVVWQGWQEIALRVRHEFARDGPALRFRLDWEHGDRDGVVEPFEERFLPQLRYDYGEEAIDTGSTSAFLTVNGGHYVASGVQVYEDRVLGSASSDQMASIERGRAFLLNFTMPSLAPEVRVGLRVITDTLTWARRDFLRIPGSHSFASFETSGPVQVYGRWLPYVVDPELDPENLESEAVVDVDLRFDRKLNYVAGRKSSYVAPTPLPPTGLGARVDGPDVLLEWSPPIGNTDGSKITNLAGYHVYRSSVSGSGYVRLDPLLLSTSEFRDLGAAGRASYYVVIAVNTDGRHSAYSMEVSMVPAGQSAAPVAGAVASDLPLVPASALVIILLLLRRRRRPKPAFASHPHYR